MSERYDEIMKMKPQDRIAVPVDPLSDRIAGILIGFGQAFDDAKGWMDESTISDADREFRQLIKDIKKGLYDNYI